MEAIKNQVSPNCKSTKFELLVSFLWKCRIIALDLHPGENRQAAVSKAGLLCSNSLTYAVELVKKLKDHMSEEYIKSVTNLMVIKGRPELSKSWNFIVSDNRSVGFDEFDFGWGKPIFGGVSEAISYISIGISVNNEKGERGILVAISLPPLAMENFQKIVYKMTFKNVEGANIISKM
ncbi:hypothetical protein H5410_040208 [Solanum commersonii]|uniref:Uncharacterized protein n=1 Tax=Solanum commersonii TaxID=4109 RepID=A0A9J5XRU0_SOLCO|nr:hypothetical protein H5410_040208 [Solanum commersonii]